MKHIKLFESFINEGLFSSIGKAIDYTVSAAVDIITNRQEYEDFEKFLNSLVNELQGLKNIEKGTKMEIDNANLMDLYIIDCTKGQRFLSLSKVGDFYLISLDDDEGNQIGKADIASKKDASKAFEALASALKK